jgi:hypothetical protein
VKQLDDLSMEIQRFSTFSDEAVKEAEALLLTFTQIRGPILIGATKAVADLATRMGGDLKGAAIQLGKALQDPATGLTALRRSGVSFSEAQTKLIKNLFDTNRAAEGQALILKELQVEFGGSAEAARNTLGGALAHLNNVWGDLFEASKESSSGMIDAINSVADAIPHISEALSTVVKWIEKATVNYAGLWELIKKTVGLSSLSFDEIRTAVQQSTLEIELGANWLDKYTKNIEKTGAATAKTNVETEEQAKLAKKVREANEDLIREAEQRLALAGLEGDALERQRIEFEAVNKAIKARRELTGDLLVQTENAIKRERELSIATMETAAAHRAAKEAHEAAVKFEEEATQEVLDKLKTALGPDSPIKAAFMALAESLVSVFKDRFIKPALAAMMPLQDALDKGLISTNDIGNAGKSLGPGKWATGGAMGLAGFGVGFGIGGMTTNRTTGALGGAAGGAATGAAIGAMGGPIGIGMGALIGGLAGLAGGLLGSSKAAKEAQDAERALRAQYALNVAQIKLQLGAITPLQAALQANAKAFSDLNEEVQKAYAGTKNEVEREKQLAVLATLEQQRSDQLREEAAYLAKVMDQELAVRGLRVNGFKEEADALAFAMAQEKEYRDAKTQGATAAQLATLQTIQLAEAQQREAQLAEERRQAQEDLNLRLAVALGLTQDEAEERQAQIAAQREYAKAVEDGKNALYLATLQQTQHAEAVSRAMDRIKATISSLSGTIAGLEGFRDSLKLSAVVTDADRLAEAKRQYDAVVGLALSGNQEAAGRLPGVANTFLDASRAVNASTTPFQDDFKKVQADTQRIIDVFQSQKTAAEKQLEELQKIRLAIEAQNAMLNIADPIVDWQKRFPGVDPSTVDWGGGSAGGSGGVSSADAVAVLQAGFSQLVDRVEELTSAVEANTSVTRDGFESRNLALT